MTQTRKHTVNKHLMTNRNISWNEKSKQYRTFIVHLTKNVNLEKTIKWIKECESLSMLITLKTSFDEDTNNRLIRLGNSIGDLINFLKDLKKVFENTSSIFTDGTFDTIHDWLKRNNIQTLEIENKINEKVAAYSQLTVELCQDSESYKSSEEDDAGSDSELESTNKFRI